MVDETLQVLGGGRGWGEKERERGHCPGVLGESLAGLTLALGPLSNG